MASEHYLHYNGTSVIAMQVGAEPFAKIGEWLGRHEVKWSVDQGGRFYLPDAHQTPADKGDWIVLGPGELVQIYRERMFPALFTEI